MSNNKSLKSTLTKPIGLIDLSSLLSHKFQLPVLTTQKKLIMCKQVELISNNQLSMLSKWSELNPSFIVHFTSKKSPQGYVARECTLVCEPEGKKYNKQDDDRNYYLKGNRVTLLESSIADTNDKIANAIDSIL